MKQSVLLAVLACLLMAVMQTGCSNPSEPAAEDDPAWEDIFSGRERHVYLAGIKMTEQTDQGDWIYALTVGTAFKMKNGGFYTNAHVALVLHKLKEMYFSWPESTFSAVPVLIPSGGDVFNDALPLQSFIIHPGYDTTTGSPDLARLYVSGGSVTTAGLTRAGVNAVTALKIGQEVGHLGFPGETTVDNIYAPMATGKTGIISALRPFKYYYDPDAVPAYFIQYSGDLTGGTSGSPVFNLDGDIIAVNNSGYTTGSLNFGIRSDLLADLENPSAAPVAFNAAHTETDWFRIRGGERVGQLYLNTAAPVTAASGYARQENGVYFYTDSLSYVVQAYAPSGIITALRLYGFDYDDFDPPHETEEGIYIGASSTYIPVRYDPAGITHDTVTVDGEIRKITRVDPDGITFMLRDSRSAITEIYVHQPSTTVDFDDFIYEEDYLKKTAAIRETVRPVPAQLAKQFLKD